MSAAESAGKDPSTISSREGFGAELTQARVRAGLTVREVAKATGMSASTVGGYFSGRHLPSPSQMEVLAQILRACGVAPDAVGAWQDAAARIRRAPGPRPAGPAPYRGLACFEPEDTAWYFGRDELVALVRAWLAEAEGAGGILFVVGPSGSGKSSLLRAGVIGQLRAAKALSQSDSAALPGPAALFTPGEDPLERLAAAKADVGSSRTDPLIVIDQFEELFQHPITTQHRFVQTLADTAKPAGGAIPVVLGMRSDFYSQALCHSALAEALQRSQIVVGPMSLDSLRLAIVEPARRAKVEIEQGLVELLLRDMASSLTDDDAGHEPGALPVLSHALLATWEKGKRSRMTIAGYAATGGAKGAVALAAEAAFTALDERQQTMVFRTTKIVNMSRSDVTLCA